jgi:hypothetical protein
MKSTDLGGEVGNDTVPKELIAVSVLLRLYIRLRRSSYFQNHGSNTMKERLDAVENSKKSLETNATTLRHVFPFNSDIRLD